MQDDLSEARTRALLSVFYAGASAGAAKAERARARSERARAACELQRIYHLLVSDRAPVPGELERFIADLSRMPEVIRREASGRDVTTMRVSIVKRCELSNPTEVSAEVADEVVSAIGTNRLRKDPQADGSVHPLIARCAGIDFSQPGARQQTKLILDALLASGTLEQGTEYIGGKLRPVVFAPAHHSEK